MPDKKTAKKKSGTKKPTKKKPLGRPTKYNATIQKKADDYINKYKDLDQVIPSTAGLAVYLKISKKTLYNWAETNKAFLHTLETIQDMQELIAVNSGLSGAFQPTITKLVLANHGYHEKQDIEHSGNISTEKIDYSKLTDKELADMRRLANKARNQGN